MGPLGAVAGMMGSGPTSQVASAYHTRRENEKARDMALYMYEQSRIDAASAHQIEAADLEKAGLNRILSMGGQGAPVQHGTPVKGDPIWTTKDGERMSNAALGFQKLKSDVKAVDSQVALNEEAVNTQKTTQAANIAATQKQNQEANLALQLAGKAKADTNVANVAAIKGGEDAKLVRQQQAIQALEELKLKNELPARAAEARTRQKNATIANDPTMNAIDNLLNRINPLSVFKAVQ